MVESFQQQLTEILQLLETKFGNVVLFAVFKMDEITDKWSILVGSEWVNETTRKEAFSYLIDCMKENLNEEERFSIARIGIMNSQDHLVQLMLDTFKTGESVVDDCKVNGNIIHEGIILKSSKSE